MIICQRNDVHAHIRQISNGIRPCPECKLFLRRRRASVRIGKFIVQHHDIGALHLSNQIRRDAIADVAAVLQHFGHYAVIGVEKDISGKQKRHILFGKGLFGINIMFRHISLVLQNIRITAIVHRRFRPFFRFAPVLFLVTLLPVFFFHGFRRLRFLRFRIIFFGRFLLFMKIQPA